MSETENANIDDANVDDASASDAKSRPDYTLVPLGSDMPVTTPPRRRGGGEGGTRTAGGPRGLTLLLQPITQDTAMWSVDGEPDKWLRIARYNNGTGAKGAIKNFAAHPEKLPVHDGAELWESASWDFTDTRHYVNSDGEDVETADADETCTRVSQLNARYVVTAEEYMRVVGRGGGEPTSSAVDADQPWDETDEREAEHEAEEADTHESDFGPVDDDGFPIQ